MDGSTKRLRAKRSARHKAKGSGGGMDAVTEACVGHLYTIVGRMEYISTNAALVLLGVVTISTTLDREAMQEVDAQRVFFAGYGSEDPDKWENVSASGGGDGLASMYMRLILGAVTPAMFAMVGSILFVVVLPSEAAFHKNAAETAADTRGRQAHIAFVDSIHRMPKHIRAMCGLPEQRSCFTVLGFLYGAIHFALFASVVMLATIFGIHMEIYGNPLPVTGTDCVGEWKDLGSGAVSPTYREGWAWKGAYPYFNATPYAATLTEDEQARHSAHCRANGAHAVLPARQSLSTGSGQGERQATKWSNQSGLRVRVHAVQTRLRCTRCRCVCARVCGVDACMPRLQVLRSIKLAPCFMLACGSPLHEHACVCARACGTRHQPQCKTATRITLETSLTAETT